MRLKAARGAKFSLTLALTCLPLFVFLPDAFSSRRSSAAQAQQSPSPDCPRLNSDIVATEWIGRTVHHTISASLTGGTMPERELTYRWKVSHGKITGGQGTHSITVEMPECECDLSVETEVEGLEAGCRKLVNWGINDLCFYPVSEENYGDIGRDKEQALLSKHVPTLKKGQCWQMRITAHGKKGEQSGETLARARGAKEYILIEHGVEADRVTVVEGESLDEPRISLLVFHDRFRSKEKSQP